ncbi:hypothetical protein POTOM_052403 [Populus tomentosa]|uniref:Uncharacterized protein n=1 Tax=Populus tomentosa TaxID=118781 RepID=A0A8X7Y7R7_POPTO|nr:hypothetical protein POTOM_052403 [Populus tomentosa]
MRTPPGETESDDGPRLSRADMDQLLLDPDMWSRIKLGINMPARAERTVRRSDCEYLLVGEPTGELYEVCDNGSLVSSYRIDLFIPSMLSISTFTCLSKYGIANTRVLHASNEKRSNVDPSASEEEIWKLT